MLRGKICRYLLRKGEEDLNFIRNRFPHRSDIIAVLSVAVFACFSWSILGFFNKFSSFILYFTAAEIAEIFAVMMASALLESLAVTGFLLLLCFMLPSHWLRDGFALKGFVSIAVLTTTSILLQKYLDNYPPIPVLMLMILVPLAAILGILFLLRSKPKLQSILLGFQDRVMIMLFLYLPLGLVALMVVLYRNLL